MRLIDADVMIEKFMSIKECMGGGNDSLANNLLNGFCAFVESTPTVDAEIVRYGSWEHNESRNGLYCCSLCEGIAPTDGVAQELTIYCPNCGSKMYGGVKFNGGIN